MQNRFFSCCFFTPDEQISSGSVTVCFDRMQMQRSSGSQENTIVLLKPMAALMAFHDRISDVAGHSLARASFNSSSEKVVRKQYSA